MPKKQILLLLVSWVPLFLRATETPRVINFPPSTYQAQNQNWMVAQAPDGFLYFANSAGLLEYDGVRWTLYPLPEGQIVRAVACDSEGHIYTGGFAEFGYWERDESGLLTYHSLSNKVKNGKVEQEETWHILLAEENIFFQSFSSIYRYHDGEVELMEPPGNIMYLRQAHGRILLPVLGQGLYEMDIGGRFTFLEGSAFLSTMTVMDILPHGQGLLICTNRNGLYTYRDGRFAAWENPLNESLKTLQLNKACLLSNGRLAFGTILGGTFILDTGARLQFHLDKEAGLQDNTVLALCESRDGNLWLGLDKGVDMAVLSEALVYFHDKSGKLGSAYTAILHQGRLYVGTNHGVFAKPWPTRLQADFQLVDGTQGQAWELKVFGNQLLCGHNEGTFLIEGMHAKKVSEVTGGWMATSVPGKAGLLLQGTYTGFIILKKGDDGAWQFSHRLEGFSQPIKSLVWDKQGRIWAANPYRGLHQIVPDKDMKRVNQIRSFGKADGLPSEFGVEVEQLDGQLAIRSGCQLFTWDEKQQQLVRLDSLFGMPAPEEPCRLIAGAPGEFFLAFPKRVLWFRGNSPPTELPLTMIPNNETAILLDEFTYLFCLDDGYALLSRNAQPLKPVKGTPLITRIETPGYKLQQVNLHEPLILPPGRRLAIRFYYTFPQFTRTCQFRYHLAGFTDGWSEWETTTYREFANLPPGAYQFRVQSSLSAAVAVFDFTVQAHWYQSRWMWLLYFLLLIGAFAAWERLSRYRLARQRRSMEIQRERELHQQRIQARNEQLQAGLLNKSRQLTSSTANLIRKNEILQQIKQELLSLRVKDQDKNLARHFSNLIHLIDSHISSEQDWKLFEDNFNEVHEAFFKKLMAEFPGLTPGDLRLAAYLKMNLSSKEIAPLLNISVRGVENKRYRLRKKMGLPADVNLTEVMMAY